MRKSAFESDDGYKRWADDMRARLIPKMRDSAHVLMIAPKIGEKFDIDFALQIGSCILLEKPLILLVDPSRTIPPKLRAIADRIIEANLDDVTMDAPEIQRQLRQAMADLGKQ